MLREIKQIIENYLTSKSLTDFVTGEYTENGLKVTSNFTIPKELVYVPNWLKEQMNETEMSLEHTHEYLQNTVLSYGDRVLCLRGFSGKLYVVLDVMK